jgi:chemotaxis protein MotB
MARKKPHEEHENHERYLVTYSDLITLLLAFFIILYAMSASDPNKFNDVARALRLGFLPTSEQTSLASLPLQSPNARTKTTQEEVQMMKSVKENNDLEKIKKKIDQKIRENPEMIDKVSTS